MAIIRYEQGKLPKLTKEQKAELAVLAQMDDSDIDTSDIPPLSEVQWANAVRGRFHREAQKPRHAVAARFDTLTHRVVIELDNCADFSFPPNLAQGLGDSSDADLQQIEISPLGTGLHWPKLDVDLTVDGLLAGVFGSRHWMRELAAKAGATKSSAKSAAARAIGSLGGRPRKTPVSA